LTTGRTGAWAEDEDRKLKDAVQIHGSKNWYAIAVLVPGRTRNQWHDRWRDVLDSSILCSMVVKMERHPIEEAEAIMPTDIVSSGSRSAITTTTVRMSRKAARRTEPLYIPPLPRRGTGQRQLPKHFASPPQNEDISASKKPRFEEALPTTRARTSDEAARKTPSPDLSVGLSPPAADGDIDDAITDPVLDTQPDAVATGSWTLEADEKLTSVVSSTSKKRWGKEYNTDWVAVAALVPGRTEVQCRKRWYNVSDPSIDQANERTGK
jgi:hypothetical protein